MLFLESSCIILLFNILGCSGSPPVYNPPKERTINKDQIIYKSYDEVWQLIVSWFATHNSPIKVIDKSSGLIATEYNLSVDLGDKYLDCGNAKIGSTDYQGNEITSIQVENHKGNFNVLLKKIDNNSTSVSINFFATAKINQYSNKTGRLEMSEDVNCYTKGVLETEIFDALAR